MSLRLLLWVWQFSWGGGQRVSASLGTLQQLRGSAWGVVGVTQESRPSGVGFSSPPVFVPPSAVNGGGRDLHQHTHQNKTKSGVNCVSVWACVSICEGGRWEEEDDNTHSTCSSFCQEMRFQTMRVTRVSFKFVMLGEWSERGEQSMEWLWLLLVFYNLFYSNLKEQICECLQLTGSELFQIGSAKAALAAYGETWLQSRSVLSVRAAKTSCLVHCHVTSVSCSLGGARSSTPSSSSVALSCI